jgi:DNA-binding transcriptional regulator/RsmH inhibitor MraZ
MGVRDHIELWNSEVWEEYLSGHMAQYQKQMSQARQRLLQEQKEDY